MIGDVGAGAPGGGRLRDAGLGRRPRRELTAGRSARGFEGHPAAPAAGPSAGSRRRSTTTSATTCPATRSPAATSSATPTSATSSGATCSRDYVRRRSALDRPRRTARSPTRTAARGSAVDEPRLLRRGRLRAPLRRRPGRRARPCFGSRDRREAPVRRRAASRHRSPRTPIRRRPTLRLKRKSKRSERGDRPILGSDEPGSTLRMPSSSAGDWKPCGAKRKLRHLDPGRHRVPRPRHRRRRQHGPDPGEEAVQDPGLRA